MWKNINHFNYYAPMNFLCPESILTGFWRGKKKDTKMAAIYGLQLTLPRKRVYSDSVFID